MFKIRLQQHIADLGFFVAPPYPHHVPRNLLEIENQIFKIFYFSKNPVFELVPGSVTRPARPPVPSPHFSRTFLDFPRNSVPRTRARVQYTE